MELWEQTSLIKITPNSTISHFCCIYVYCSPRFHNIQVQMKRNLWLWIMNTVINPFNRKYWKCRSYKIKHTASWISDECICSHTPLHTSHPVWQHYPPEKMTHSCVPTILILTGSFECAQHKSQQSTHVHVYSDSVHDHTAVHLAWGDVRCSSRDNARQWTFMTVALSTGRAQRWPLEWDGRGQMSSRGGKQKSRWQENRKS